jgi:cytochrome P450
VKAGIPTVKGFPLLGSLLPLSRNALEFFSRVFVDNGDRVLLRVLGRSVMLLSHPDDIERVLVHDRESFGRSAELRKLRPIFGRGLLASDGDLWSRQRTLIQPSFQPNAIARYSSTMLDAARRLTLTWRAGETRDIHADMMQYTRETICRVIFGDEFATHQPGIAAAVSMVFGDLRSEILYLPIWRRLPLARARRWNRAVRLLERTLRSAIAARHAAIAAHHADADAGVEQDAAHDDLLAALLAARGPDGEAMPDQQVLDEILTFFLAGHETTALSLTWAAYLLAQHPDVQDRMREEIRAVTQGSELCAEHYPKLRWTAAILKEATRLYPPVWSMGREAITDTVLDGHPVAKGTDVWICLHRLHRDARWFPEPERFQPERWLQGQTQKPFTYLPFGVGPRVCIGQRFALMETVLGLAAMVSHFRLTVTDDVPAEPSAWITLRPKHPIRLRLD